jgi:hypothetical protein
MRGHMAKEPYDRGSVCGTSLINCRLRGARGGAPLAQALFGETLGTLFQRLEGAALGKQN